jgi:hypothetical protein
MSANKIFSPKRFWNLIFNDLVIYRKTYIFYTLGIGIITYLSLLWAMTVSRNFYLNDYIPFLSIYYIAVGISIGSAFPDFNNKIKTANYLLLPASAFEKFLSQLLLKVLIAFALSVCIFWIDTRLAQRTAWSFAPLWDVREIADFSYKEIFRDITGLRNILALIFGLFSFATFLFSARLFFGKFAVIKTVISAVIVVFAFVGCMVLVSHIVYPETHGWNTKMNGHKIGGIYAMTWYGYLIAWISWIFFLLTGYYKLKEKQI